MRVAICHAQRRFDVDTSALRRLVRDLAGLARTPAERPWQEVTVHLLDDAGIASVNQAVLGHEGTTDVITQRYEPIPGEDGGLVGELFVNVALARRAAPRRVVGRPRARPLSGARLRPSDRRGRRHAARTRPHAPPRTGMAQAAFVDTALPKR